MSVSRSPFDLRPLLAWVLLLGFAAGPALAQSDQKPAPSPVAPGDLTKPVFDTKTPIYDSVTSLDKAASTEVAEVEGRPITMGDVGDAIRALPPAMAQYPFDALYPSVLDQLVRLQALVIRAQNQGLDEDPVVRRRTRNATAHVLADEYVRHEAEKGITEEALLERYKRDIEGKPGPEQVHVRVIMVPTEKEAEALIEQLKGGADFATLARQSSKDTTAPVGGDLGFVTRDGLNAEIGSVAFATPAGQLAPYPVLSVGSWFIVRVDERRREPTPPYSVAREPLREAMLKEAAAVVMRGATQGFKVRQFDFMGHETGDGEQPAAGKLDGGK